MQQVDTEGKCQLLSSDFVDVLGQLLKYEGFGVTYTLSNNSRCISCKNSLIPLPDSSNVYSLIRDYFVSVGCSHELEKLDKSIENLPYVRYLIDGADLAQVPRRLGVEDDKVINLITKFYDAHLFREQKKHQHIRQQHPSRPYNTHAH